jgi:hypothetical protein
MSDYSSDGANDDVFSMRDHVDDVLEFKEEPSDCCPDLVDLEQRKHAYVEDLATHKVSARLSCDAVWFFCLIAFLSKTFLFKCS